MNDDTKKFFEKLAQANRSSEPVMEEPQEFEPRLAVATKKAEKIEKEEEESEPFDEGEGQLAIDVYQTPSDIIVEAPVAGLAIDDLDIEITPDSVTVKGKRDKKEKVDKKDYLYQECYWGRFSRSVILPQEIDPEAASATFKDCVLKITLPKKNKQRSKKLKVRFE